MCGWIWFVVLVISVAINLMSWFNYTRSEKNIQLAQEIFDAAKGDE